MHMQPERPPGSVYYHLFVVRPEPPGRFTAQPLGVPEVARVADTAEEAVEQARQALEQWGGSLRWAAVRISPPAGPSFLDLAGHARDDPDFDAYLEEIQRGRREADQRECSDTSSTPTT